MKNIRRNPLSGTITWIPPFSLNLTNAEPDIAYCLKVYNITCGVRALLVNTCRLLEPQYRNSVLHKADLFEITVTPRSNIEYAHNGINQTIKGGCWMLATLISLFYYHTNAFSEKYLHFDDTSISSNLRKTSSNTVDVQVHLNTHVSLILERAPHMKKFWPNRDIS